MLEIQTAQDLILELQTPQESVTSKKRGFLQGEYVSYGASKY